MQVVKCVYKSTGRLKWSVAARTVIPGHCFTDKFQTVHITYLRRVVALSVLVVLEIFFFFQRRSAISDTEGTVSCHYYPLNDELCTLSVT